MMMRREPSGRSGRSTTVVACWPYRVASSRSFDGAVHWRLTRRRSWYRYRGASGTSGESMKWRWSAATKPY